MRRVLTAFDSKSLPLQSLVVDGNDVKFYVFYASGTGMSIRTIKESMKRFKNLLEGRVFLNDFKSHAESFSLDDRTDYEAYDMAVGNQVLEGKKSLLSLYMLVKDLKPMQWNKLMANASIVYRYLNRIGFYSGGMWYPMKYDLFTSSGRSRMTGFNVQGLDDSYDLKSKYGYKYFICLDWMAADLRMGAKLSKDPIMEESFLTSDPYTVASKACKLDRDDCKKRLFHAIYSMNPDDPVLKTFPTFREWMRSKSSDMQVSGGLSTILGRNFVMTGDNVLSVFNAQLQGSVAHAMQAALIKVYEKCPMNLFAEIHDSLILSCDVKSCADVIDAVGDMFLNPLEGWMDDPPIMPYSVSIGSRWRKWKKCTVVRS